MLFFVGFDNNFDKSRLMKSFLYAISLVALLGWVREIAAAYCSSPFQDVPYSTGYYCAKCDTTCSTCLGSAINQCSTCPTDFTLDANSSTCAAPINSSVETIANMYHSFNFISEWTSTSTSNCGSVTLVTPLTSTAAITITHTLPAHYQIRVMVAFWSITGSSQTLGFTYSDLNAATAYSLPFTSTGSVNSNIFPQSYMASCTNAFGLNYQKYVNDSTINPKSVQVKFTSSASSWGVNQYNFIVYKCSLPDCASCIGPTASQCSSCADTNKQLYTNPGKCECSHSMGYYAYPTGNTTYYCVNPCPNLPSGQYYGDNSTRTCVLSCPTDATNTNFWGLTFASDVDNLCVKQCWASITLGGTVFPLYYDLVGRKCTTKCPSAQPYSFYQDKACYANCPANSVNVQYYNLDLDYTCVATCPMVTNSTGGGQIPLFKLKVTTTGATGGVAYIYICVEVCPTSTYGYTDASGVRECVSSCPNPQFADNSTGRPICRAVCAKPNWFGNIPPATCVTTCPSGFFGDQNDPNDKRQCVSKCNGSYYGLPNGGHCVNACPDGMWGEYLDMICVSYVYQCDPTFKHASFVFANTTLPNVTGAYPFYPADGMAFADDFSHKCVWANETCSKNQYKLNSTSKCVLTCPSNTYAHPLTFWCVDFCYGVYFADPQLNQCVKVCSPGLFADKGTSNKCVSRCNQTGGYPYRDSDLRQCVSVCSNGYADPIAQSCIFNCTPGLYLNGSDQSNQTYKVCAYNCTSPYFAYNNTDSGICLQTCPQNPILFGDTVGGLRVCVQVCTMGTYGDQTNNSYRHCVSQCPNTTYAQNDTLRRCVTRCKTDTYGRSTDWTCVDPLLCPTDYTGDPTTNLCVNWCPTANGTFADNISHLCVARCPNDNGTLYYADQHIRRCIPQCINYNASVSEFGNNNTQTCEQKCLDNDSFADAQSPRRYCIALCTNTNSTKYYRNNYTMICVVSTACPTNLFADNLTAYCVSKCSIVTSSTNASLLVQTWGYQLTQTCVETCFDQTFGDNSTGIPLCVSLCPDLPVPKWSYLGPNDNMTIMLCMLVCPAPYFGEDYFRTCVTACPRVTTTAPIHAQTYSYDITRRCLLQCPNTTFADYIQGICYHFSVNCTIPCAYTATTCSTYRWGDPYNNSCTYLCTASPWDTYGDNTTQTCTTKCAASSYADNYTGTRTCIAQCPGYYTAQGLVKNITNITLDIRGIPYDSYGDNYTQRCVQHCVMPQTYADWQTHLCALRCTGDVSTTVPTYANIFNKRCEIALFCPVGPDLYFGQNITRMCQPSCPYYNFSNYNSATNSSFYNPFYYNASFYNASFYNASTAYVSFADNITRSCIPDCYQYYNATSNLTTMFYGDVSKTRPACVVACPIVPRLFGRNDTYRCVAECPNYQYGDQTGNRSCVPVCPLINGTTWFSQLTERICVVVCEDGTWGNYYNNTPGPHCETVGTDCKPDQFGDNSTHLCVDLCPESMNYFGDPSTRLCTTLCPLLDASLFNATANINLAAGRLFADSKTRLCVYTCPLDYGLQGTFGDNSTNTCVERCPDGSFGDANTVNRFCVAQCTGGAYADPYTMLCVDVCPASPPLYGYNGNWTCVQRCPSGLWADDTTRTCVSDCNPEYRLIATNECVGVCPAQLDLYGDSNGHNCVATCTNGLFADPTDRICKTNCTPLFQYNYRCVKYCPKGTFANSTKNCVPPKLCDNVTFGDNDTTKCVSPCPAWSFADSVSGYCIAICPAGTYGENLICQPNCLITGTNSSNITQQCMSKCPNGTYSLLGACVPNCTGATYQREDTRICDTKCALDLWADANSHRCVRTCPYNWFRQKFDTNKGYCVAMNGGCSPYFADFQTGDCVIKCSSGYWGFGDSSNLTHNFVGNYSCLRKCPPGLYGYDDGTERNCYPPNGLPIVATLFADTISGQFVPECPQLPLLYYGDTNRQFCLAQCQSFNLNANVITLFYGDPQARQCKSSCSNSTYSADNTTHLCTLKCSLGTFRYNNTPVCVNPCFVGYGDYTTRICVAVCPQSAGTFGFYNTTSGSRMCLNQCPLTYYAEPLQRTCTALCPKIANNTIFYYAYNDTRECLLSCKGSFADDSNQRCVKQCLSNSFPNADNSTNRCVPVCPSTPDYYADNHVCVFYCVTPNTFADSNGRICTSRCSNNTANQYGDSRTGRCEVNCSQGTWGDNTTNLCVPVCPDGSFADNTTGKCVAQCPKIQNIYADMILHVCAYTCSHGRFGSLVNQTCIDVCDNGYWGDPTTTLCTQLCPVKIYSYGQNDTRTCVTSCAAYTGYADNYSRLCRQYCQHTLPVETYIDYTTYSCVEICPQGYYAVNHSAPGETINKCSQHCNNGYADNFSQWCVNACPDDPETYGDTTHHTCVYTCRAGEFSDNTTNLCVPICPSLLSTPAADYFGDPVTGRCVLWCTEGTYAQDDTSRLCVNPCPVNEFADNLTRRCVAHCPPSQATFADPTTHRCVRICPHGLWAENLTQTCQAHCITYTTAPLIGVVAYADNMTNFCVRQCPFGYFGTNLTHECVPICPPSQKQYGHFIGRVCVGTDPVTGTVDCYPDVHTGMVYYADNTTQTCVQKCPLNLWADTHLQKCVENCDASLHEYRNRQTQMCVWPCPVDPDEFADPASGNCVRTCPNGTFASNNNRTCLSGCGEFLLFGDNTTNRCQPKCATLPYLFADSLTHLCVFHCSGGQFADNRSQTCVQVCPVEWAYFGDTQTQTCVSLCPDGFFADANALRTCRSTCTNNYFSDNFTSSCVQHCRFVRPFWYQDTSTGPGVCVAVCPGESYAYNPDQTCKYQDPVTFASTCPPPYFADRVSRQCVKTCPAGRFADGNTRYCEPTCSGIYYADPILRVCAPTCSGNLFQYVLSATSNLCVQYCPSPLFAQNGTVGIPSQCVPVCTTLGLPSTRTCETYCPHPYFADIANHLCVPTCDPFMKYIPTRTCLQTCLAPYYANPINFTCDLLCPEGYFGRNTTRRCDTTCLALSFADPSLRVCVAVCPGSPLLFSDTRTSQCLDYCTSPLFAYGVDFSCRSSCPNITTPGGQNLVYLADASNRRCVLQCVNAVISFADYSSNECTQFCPSGTFANNYTKQCVKTCPNVPNDTFSYNTSHICMDVCLPGSFGMSSKLNCVQDCWWPFYADPTTRTCVDFCPPGYFAQNSTATCRTTCPSMSYADPVTRRCLATCPWLQKYYNFDGNWTCLQSCPPGYFASDKYLACLSICNNSVGWFAYLPTGDCKQECPMPYRGFAPNFTCVLSCPEQYYFYDVTINVCAQCDSKCILCSSLTTCLQCKPSYNLFSGYCTRSCLPSGGVITYADPSGSCVKVCPTGWFGDNSNNTYACVQDCPTMQFGDMTTQLCQYCPPTCASCTSMTNCLTCATAATLAIDNMCYRDCNATFKYTYNGTCYNTCPGGSYLTYTGVTCAPCGPLCLTCTGTPTICTSCANTYFYNSTCLTTCPQGFYGSTTLQCLSCSGSDSAACTKPLNFSTSYSTQNFKPVITLQFNQNITTTKDISEILKINVNPKRRLEEDGEDNEWLRQRQLSIGTIVNNGITYSYEILPNGTILLYPEVGTSLVSPTFSVSISDPTAVTSASTGASLQNVQSQLSVAAVEFYPPEQSTKAETNFPAKLVTVLALVLFGVTFFFSDVMIRPLQWLQILCFHCLITVGVPPNIYYHLFQMKNSTLEFLTNWFEGSLPKMSPYYSTPQKIADTFIDEIFLRHLGSFFLVAVVFGCFWFFFLTISSKFVMRHKIWQGFFQEISRKRFQLMLINDTFSLFYFPILYFAMMQMNNLLSPGSFYALNAALTIILFICAIIMPIAWTTLWKVRTRQEVHEKLWFLTLRVKPLAQDQQAFRVHDVHDQKSVERLKEKSSQHSKDFNEPAEQPTKNERNPRQLQSVVFMWYQTVMALWMVALYTSPMMQLGLLIATNCIFLLYHLKVRPQLNNINLIFTILAILAMILFEGLYLYFQTHTELTATQKSNVAFPFLVAADVFCILFALWAVWRVIWETSFYWRNFKQTQLYIQFADHDYVNEAEKTSEYSLYERKAEILEAGLGDIVIDEILEKVGESGEKIIAVRKKRLRKKAKVQGRKKMDGSELLPDDSVREEYVRVNQHNVFDFHEEFQEEPEQKPQPRRRVIDDDVRDMISDDDEPAIYREEDQEEKKIDIDPEDQMLDHIDSISAVNNNVARSERISEFPFFEVEQEDQRPEEEKMDEEEESVHAKPDFYPIEHHKEEKQSPRESPRVQIQYSIAKKEEEPQGEEYAYEQQSEMESRKEQQRVEYRERDEEYEQRYQQMKSETSQLPQQPVVQQPPSVIDPQQQLKSQQEQGALIDQSIPAVSAEQKPQEMQSVNIEDLPAENDFQLERPKMKNIQDLLLEEELGKKKNLLFLFDDFDEEEP